jgi:hypothetical protein
MICSPDAVNFGRKKLTALPETPGPGITHTVTNLNARYTGLDIPESIHRVHGLYTRNTAARLASSSLESVDRESPVGRGRALPPHPTSVSPDSGDPSRIRAIRGSSRRIRGAGKRRGGQEGRWTRC